LVEQEELLAVEAVAVALRGNLPVSVDKAEQAATVLLS
jgi:hypothetical protein